MGLRLVNTAPGIITDPIQPGQYLHMGLKSETLSVQIADTTLDVGLSSFAHTNVLPEDNTQLTTIGVTQDFQTSERRQPITGSVTKSLSGGSIVLTRTSNSLGDLSIYELGIPIHEGDSIMGYFKFRKKSAWATFNADWCTATNLAGMYFGVEHGTFNSAAYAFLRNNGTGGSIVFAGPLQAFSTVRPGQTELAQDLDPVAGGTQGWMGLADNATIELFIRFNTFVVPFRAELWTRIASTPAPVFQGSILLGALGTFPSTFFSNGRAVPAPDVARIFFGNIGHTGDILQLDDWALFPDYRTIIKAGAATSNSSIVRNPDAPLLYNVGDKQLPVNVLGGRWFPGPGLTPAPTFFYNPGQRITPDHLIMEKHGNSAMTYQRTEPRLEQRQDGMMIESFMSATSESRIGDLIGPGFGIDDGLNSFRVQALETVVQKMYGIPSSFSTFSDSTTYYATPAIDFRSPKLIRLTVDRRRQRVTLSVDDEKLVDVPMLTVAQLNSGIQTVPTLALNGTALHIEVSTDTGATWTAHSHTFSAEMPDVASIVADLNGDAGFTGAGLGQIEVIDMGETFGFRTIHTGSNMGLRVAASTAVGTQKLNLTIPGTTFGATGVFPAASGAGLAYFGHAFSANYAAQLNLRTLNYLNRYLAWETEDSLLPDSVAIDSSRRFTLNVNGVGGSAITPTALTINKSDFSNATAKRFYQLNQALTNQGGIQLDFGLSVLSYTDSTGLINASGTSIELGTIIFLGNKRVQFALFDCGLAGRRIGIIPGSGSEDDILNQTALGRSFSAAVDWEPDNLYRIVVRAYHSIQVWSGTTIDAPVITIPWRDDVNEFDLPLDVTTPGVAFGHFNLFTKNSASISKWRYVRWGHSNGYEISSQQNYPNGLKSYLFGGRAFIYSDFNEA